MDGWIQEDEIEETISKMKLRNVAEETILQQTLLSMEGRK